MATCAKTEEGGSDRKKQRDTERQSDGETDGDVHELLLPRIFQTPDTSAETTTAKTTL